MPGVDAVTLARYANAVLGACQTLLEDEATPSALLPPLLAVVQQAARHQHSIRWDGCTAGDWDAAAAATAACVASAPLRALPGRPVPQLAAASPPLCSCTTGHVSRTWPTCCWAGPWSRRCRMPPGKRLLAG